MFVAEAEVPSDARGIRAFLNRPFWVVAAGITALLFTCAFTPVNTDLGWMLRFGADAVRLGELPRENFQSFTEPHHPVFMPEWATCVCLYLLHRLGGGTALIFTKWFFAALTIGVLAVTARSATPSRIAQLLAVLGASQFLWIGFELVRAQMVTFALLAIFLWAALDTRRWTLWLCVPLMAIWVNSHGGFLAGWGVLLAVCVARGLEEHRGWAPPTRPLRDYALVPALSFAALLLNPYGPSLLSSTLAHARDPSRFLIREWVPLWEWALLSSAERTAAAILAGTLLFCALFMPPRQLRWWALWAMTLVVTPGAVRHLRLAPILLLPVLAAALALALQKAKGERLEKFAAPLAVGAATVCGLAFASMLPHTVHLSDTNLPSPANAIAVLKLNGLSGNIWNDYDWGGLLQWAAPESKVACDGRHGLAYSNELLRANMYLPAEPLELLTHYRADFALLLPGEPATAALAKQWTVLFCDADACLLSGRPEHRGDFVNTLRIPDEPLKPSTFF